MWQYIAMALVGIVGSTWVDRTTAKPINVTLIAGQSNAVGFSYTADLPPHLKWMAQPQDDILYRNTTGTVTTLRPATTTFGPELSMGRLLKDANPGQEFILQKYAVGSTSLQDAWDPETGGMYRNMLTRLTSTLGYLRKAGYEPRINGLAWIQGEEDAWHEDMALNYRANLEQFILSVREDIQADLPVVIARINAPYRQYRGLVRDAQQDINMIGVKTIDTDDLPLQDKVHWNATAQIALGNRLGAAFAEASHELPARGPILLNGVPEPNGLILCAITLFCLRPLVGRVRSGKRTSEINS